MDLLTPFLIGAGLGIIIEYIWSKTEQYVKDRRFRNNGYKYNILQRIVNSDKS